MRNIVAAVVVVAGVVGGFGCKRVAQGETVEPPAAPPAKAGAAERTTERVSAVRLVELCQQDPAALEDRYKGKRIVVTGAVRWVGPESIDVGAAAELQGRVISARQATRMQPQVVTDYVTCRGAKADRRQLGDPVKVEGTFQGVTNGVAVLTDCKVITTGS